jgi:hypothetical protein
MAIYVKQGALGTGSWKQVTDGNARVKQIYGSDWAYPTYIYAKIGGLGGGSWRDTGYRGYPNPPQNLRVYAWDFNNVALTWDAPASGGAPAVSYQVAARDSNGNGIGQPDYDDVNPPWGNFAVSEDGYYQYYVRSKSAAGLYSAWHTTGSAKAHIGHTEQGYWATENRTQGWSSEHVSGARNRDEPFWVGFGSDIVIQGMHWRNLWTPQSSVLSPGTNRTVNYIFNNGDFGAISGEIGTMYSHHNGDKGLGNQGTGQPWGIVARGAGWSTTSQLVNMLICDDFWCDGYQTYQVNVYYVTRNRQENSYW